MNATDTLERIAAGFVDLLGRLRGIDDHGNVSRRIRLNTAARERALERVRREYAANDLDAPSDLALSITARRVMAEVDAERNRTLPIDMPQEFVDEHGEAV